MEHHQQQLIGDEDLAPPPPAIPRRYPRSQCKQCGKRVAWATLVNAMDEPVRRTGGLVVRIPLDVFTVKNATYRLIPGERVRSIHELEYYDGDRFQRHKCPRKTTRKAGTR